MGYVVSKIIPLNSYSNKVSDGTMFMTYFSYIIGLWSKLDLAKQGRHVNVDGGSTQLETFAAGTFVPN